MRKYPTKKLFFFYKYIVNNFVSLYKKFLSKRGSFQKLSAAKFFFIEETENRASEK